MFRIRFKTERYRPGFRVSVRTSRDWNDDIFGSYFFDSWWFHLPADATHIEFKFVLDGHILMLGNNLNVSSTRGKTYQYEERDIQFDPDPDSRRVHPAIESSAHARRMFPFSDETDFDVIVIGSGIGGGIVAEQLADLGKRTLILEAGSLLFQTHAGNIARRRNLSSFNKDVWNLWHEHKVNFFVNQGPGYQGGMGLNLGGRSVFWGAYIPRLANFEYKAWPEAIAKYLTKEGGYARAEALLNKTVSAEKCSNAVIDRIKAVLPELSIDRLPVSLGQGDKEALSSPLGIFSTVDLISEARMTGGSEGSSNLHVQLHNLVTKIIVKEERVHKVERKRVQAVIAYDYIAGTERTYTSENIVLSAGSINSPAIALNSSIQDASGKMGVGITDHPILYLPFFIPKDSSLCDYGHTTKLVLEHKQAALDSHRYIAFVDYGTDLGLSRFYDPETYQEYLELKEGNTYCEVVFQLFAPLDDSHTVTIDGGQSLPPLVHMRHAPILPHEMEEMQRTAEKIITALGGRFINENSELQVAPIGGVAHEAGSLRIGNHGEGVVDENLRFHNFDNLFACDLSVFPCSPAANPTLTLAGLALRLADHIAS